MIEIIVEETELFEDSTGFFTLVEKTVLKLEHSLMSIHKWEAKWHKPFLKTDFTVNEILDYVRCMTITKNVDPNVYRCLTQNDMDAIVEYIKDPATAAWFNDNLIGASRNRGEIVTSETIYWWMIALNIPVEFEKWHLNQLLTLIKFVNLKNQPSKKMNKREAALYRAKLNEERRKKYNTRG